MAIKEFYFHGTPYPDGVGNTGDDLVTNEAKNGDGPAKNEGDESGSEVDEDVEGQADLQQEGDVDFAGVNCFPGRPPSSVYVTNESPSIWFKPKEVWEVRAALEFSSSISIGSSRVMPFSLLSSR